MYDRFSADGKPRSFDGSSDLSALFPVKARFIEIMGGADHKGVLVKGLIQPAGNFHNWKGQVVHSEFLEIAHYKWTDRIIDRVRCDYRVTMKREFLAPFSIRGCWTITSGTGASPGRSSAENSPHAPTDHDHMSRWLRVRAAPGVLQSSRNRAKPQRRVAERLEAEFNQRPNILPRKYTEAKKLIAKHSTPYRLVASGIH